MIYIGLIVALLGGIFISLQGGINGMMGNQVGIFTTVIVPVYTQVIILSIILASRKELWENISKLKEIKHGVLFLVISALLGLGIMTSLTFSIMKIGPLIAFAIVIFSQLLTSMIIENHGFFNSIQNPINGFKIAGLALMLLGVGLFYK